MLDFYKLPTDFPGFTDAMQFSLPRARVQHLEAALFVHWKSHPRFLPYIQLHEYEALLFSDIRRLDWGFLEDEHEPRIKALEALAATFASPEDIDQGETTAPSKRIEAHLPGYGKQKSSLGPLLAGKIGLPTIRAKCPHFHQWLKRLEEL